jgi:hypothetical protein
MGNVCVALELVVIEIEAVNAPLNSKLPAPEAAVPTPKCVIVAEPAVQGPNATAAAFDTLLPDTVQPDADRTTACLA